MIARRRLARARDPDGRGGAARRRAVAPRATPPRRAEAPRGGSEQDRDDHPRPPGQRGRRRGRHPYGHRDGRADDGPARPAGRSPSRGRGAHPTGGLVADVNSPAPPQEEYPVVLLECRGSTRPACRCPSRSARRPAGRRRPDERYQVDNAFQFPPFRVDRFATPANRVATVGQPATVARRLRLRRRWLRALGAVRRRRRQGLPRRAVRLRGHPAGGRPGRRAPFQPSNTTYGISDANGNGSAKLPRPGDRDQRVDGLPRQGGVRARRRPGHGDQL